MKEKKEENVDDTLNLLDISYWLVVGQLKPETWEVP